LDLTGSRFCVDKTLAFQAFFKCGLRRNAVSGVRLAILLLYTHFVSKNETRRNRSQAWLRLTRCFLVEIFPFWLVGCDRELQLMEVDLCYGPKRGSIVHSIIDSMTEWSGPPVHARASSNVHKFEHSKV
jgi:hypothetical protein